MRPGIARRSERSLWDGHREKNIPETRSMYTRSFFRLSEMYFKDSAWPPVEQISEFVDSDKVFCLLYQVRCSFGPFGRPSGCALGTLLPSSLCHSVAEFGRSVAVVGYVLSTLRHHSSWESNHAVAERVALGYDR